MQLAPTPDSEKVYTQEDMGSYPSQLVICPPTYPGGRSETFTPTTVTNTTGVSVMLVDWDHTGVTYDIAYRILDASDPSVNLSWGHGLVKPGGFGEFFRWFTLRATTVGHLVPSRMYTLVVWGLYCPWNQYARWVQNAETSRFVTDVWGSSAYVPTGGIPGGNGNQTSSPSQSACNPTTEHEANGVCVANVAENPLKIIAYGLAALIIIFGAVLLIMGLLT
jgi:hypothetical protein